MMMTPVLPVPRAAAKVVNVSIGLGLAGADDGERRNEAARMATVTLWSFITAPSFRPLIELGSRGCGVGRRGPVASQRSPEQTTSRSAGQTSTAFKRPGTARR